jgi:hypothetical protein
MLEESSGRQLITPNGQKLRRGRRIQERYDERTNDFGQQRFEVPPVAPNSNSLSGRAALSGGSPSVMRAPWAAALASTQETGALENGDRR